MKNKIVSTPIIWYLIGTIFLLITCACWLIFLFTNANYFAEEFFKNLFFATIGSLIVAFLIDVGNTSRDNRAEKKAFDMLKHRLDSLCKILSISAFVFSEGFHCDDEGHIRLDHFQNDEFCYKDKKITDFIKFNELISFKKDCDVEIEKIKTSSFFKDLNNQIKGLLEEIQLKGFPHLSNITIATIENCVIPGFKADLERLKDVTKQLCDLLNIDCKYSFLSNEEANDYFNERIESLKNDPIKSGIKYKTVFKGNKRLL